MKPITLDKSRIPEELRNHPEVLRLEAEVIEQFSDPEARKSTSTHEAAHEIYFARIGIKTERLGPFAYYDEANYEVHFANACVRPPNIDELPETVDIHELAKTYAAGFVAAQELTALGAIATEPEELGSDFDNFRQFCKLSHENATDRQIRNTFEEAKAAVRLDLKNDPQLVANIRRVATEFEKEVFGEWGDAA